MVNVGPNIKKFRESRGVRINKLAINVDISATFLSRVEKGEVNVSITTLEKIAQSLSIPLTYFFIDDSVTDKGCAKCKPLDYKERELVKCFVDFLFWQRGKDAKSKEDKVIPIA